MKTEFEKMRSSEPYRYDDPEVIRSVERAQRLCLRLNRLTLRSPAYRTVIGRLLPLMDPSSAVCPPFYCDHGSGVTIGASTFINQSCRMLDEAPIRIGSHVKIGPDCKFYTATHPLSYLQRREPVERGLPIIVGDDTWIGGGVTVCPGAVIGSRCVIAAGSVVRGTIPSDTLAAGNPAVVKRRLDEGSDV